MKQFFLFLSILVFSNLNAQITIMSTDISPLNAMASQSTDDSPDASIVPGGSGDQNWDFEALADNGALEFKFVEPSTTPYFDQYSSANLAAEQDGNYFYFTQDDEFLTALGTYGDFQYSVFTVTAAVHVDPPQTILQFPATFGDSYSETVVVSAEDAASVIGLDGLFDSVRIERTIVRAIAIDAFGTLKTPLGTFESIRSTENESTTDVILGKQSGENWSVYQSQPTTESTVYNWWTKDGNFGFPMVRLQTDETGAVTSANWVTDFVSGAEETFDMQFGLYPNPATAGVVVEFPASFAGKLEVVDLNGRSIFQKSVLDPREVVSTQNFAPGSYVMVVRNEDGSLAAAKRFQVIR